MPLFNLPAVRGLITQWSTQPQTAAYRQFLSNAAPLLEGSSQPATVPLHEAMVRATNLPDSPEALEEVTALLLADENDPILARVAPAAVAQQLEEVGQSALDQFIDEGKQRYLSQPVAEVLRETFRRPHPVTKQAPGRVALLEAAGRQQRVWQLLKEQPEISAHEGALSSGGDFDATMMLLYQQGSRFLWNRALKPGRSDPALAAVMTRPGSDVDALRYSAGIHKRGLPLHQMNRPFQTTAFPQSVEEGLRKIFQLQFATPTGERIETALSPDVIRELAYEGMLVYSTKSFSPNGHDVDEWIDKVRAENDRADLATNYISGFTGAKAIFAEELPQLNEFGVNGLHLGFGVSHLTAGLKLALLMTGHDEGSEGALMEVVDRVAETTVQGGATIYTFKNLSLTRPVVIDVYDDADLRKTQRLFAIYKNVYSGILGQQIFDWIFARLQQNGFTESSELISEAERTYQTMMEDAEAELRQILIDVEGIPEEKAVILELSRIDARASWQMRSGGMGRLVRLISNYFAKKDQVDPDIRQQLNKVALEKWLSEIGSVYATRNTMGGTAVAAGTEATRYMLTQDPYALLPQDITFEGLMTTRKLHVRLKDKMQHLPERVQNYIETVRHIRQPTLFPPEVRRSLSLLTHFMETRASGDEPTREEIEIFLGREATDKEVEDVFRWRATLTADDFVQAVRALINNMMVAQEMIAVQATKHRHLVVDGKRQLRIINVALLGLIKQAEAANERKDLTPLDVQRLLHALKMLIMEGDRVYLGDSYIDVFADMNERMQLMVEFLNNHGLEPGTSLRPYPRSVQEPAKDA